MTAKLLHIFEYLTGEDARQVFDSSEFIPARGYFETEDTWIAYDFTHGNKVMEFPMKWQAWAFASTDLSFDYIWELNEDEFYEMYNYAFNNGIQTYHETTGKKTA